MPRSPPDTASRSGTDPRMSTMGIFTGGRCVTRLPSRALFRTLMSREPRCSPTSPWSASPNSMLREIQVEVLEARQSNRVPQELGDEFKVETDFDTDSRRFHESSCGFCRGTADTRRQDRALHDMLWDRAKEGKMSWHDADGTFRRAIRELESVLPSMVHVDRRAVGLAGAHLLRGRRETLVEGRSRSPCSSPSWRCRSSPLRRSSSSSH